jgi:Retrotransposon gag protein
MSRTTRSQTKMPSNDETYASVLASTSTTTSPSQIDPVQEIAQLRKELELLRQPRETTPVVVPVTSHPSIPQKWPRFSGKIAESTSKSGQRISAENIDCFIFDIENAFVASNVVLDSVKLAIVSTCLENGAKTWYRVTFASITSWEDFKLKARKQFALLHFQRQLRTDLRNLRQSQNENASEYVDKFRVIAILVENMSEEDKIYEFTRGLHPAAQMQIHLRDPEMLEEAMSIAIAHDQAYRTTYNSNNRNDSKKSKFEKKTNENPNPNTSKELDVISNKPTIDWERIKKEGRCVRCLERGHIGINCPKHPGPPPSKTNMDSGKVSNQ